MDGIQTSWLLLTGGLALMALEVLAPGVYLLWFGLAALLAGGVVAGGQAAGFALGWQAALVIFCVFSFLAVGVGRWLTRAGKDREDAQPVVLNSRASALVGRITPLYQPIINGRGAVRIDDTLWSVTGLDAPAGAHVRLVAVEGNGFIVAPATPVGRVDGAGQH